MSLFMRDAQGRLHYVNPGLPADRGNQGGMGRRLSEADLMSRLPDADIVGARGPGVVPGGEQSVGARRVQLEAADANNPPVPTYRPLAGAQQNNRGNSTVVTLDVVNGMPVAFDIPSIVETSKQSGDDAEVISIQLGLDIPSQFFEIAYWPVVLDVTAVIEWGVGNAIFTAEADWSQGTCFAVCASYLRVKARIQPITSLVGVPNLDIVLRAALAYGNSNNLNVSSPARRTIIVPQIAAASNSLPISIPAWAQGFTVVDNGGIGGGAAPVTPSYGIVLSSNGAGADITYQLTSRSNLGNQVEGQFPIPAGMRFITLFNNTGVALDPRIVFNLGF